MHEIGDGRGIKAEALLRNHGDKTGAGLEGRIVELAVALVLLEVLGIRGSQECALVMIEPPGNLGGTGVLEIDDRIFVAVELLFIKQRAGTVDQSGEFEIDVAADALTIETREQRGRRSSVKTLVVIENPDSQ